MSGRVDDAIISFVVPENVGSPTDTVDPAVKSASAAASDDHVKGAAEVVSVQVATDGIRVTCADGSVETGSHVVVTVPLGVLKRGAPRFDPPLPAPVQAAVDALGFGRYEKIALRFETAFWRQDGISHLMVFASDDNEPRRSAIRCRNPLRQW